jgi:hypothetical protein
MNSIIIPKKLVDAFILHALPYMILALHASGLDPVDQVARDFHAMLREVRGFDPCNIITWAPFLSDGSGPEITRLLRNLANSSTTDRIANCARTLSLLIIKRLKMNTTTVPVEDVELCSAIIKIGTPPFALPPDDAAALRARYNISETQMRAAIHGINILEGDMAAKVSEIATRLLS